jgi:hypothetical protein
MSVSIQKSTSRTNIKHNNRMMNQKEMDQNDHIDYERSDENVYLVQKDLRGLYREEFKDFLEKYNAKQKRSDRKIKNYYEHIKSSKKTALQQEMIIQVGDQDDFSTVENRDIANEILKDWFKGFEKRNPKLKIYNAVIHNDEASPHLHLNFVPVADGYKRGLEKQVAFDKAIMQQDETLDKIRPFDDWREKEVQSLEKLLNEHGMERKFVGPNGYKDVNEYKEKKDLEKEISCLKEQVSEKKNELLEVSGQLPKEINIKVKGKEKKTEVVKTGFFKTETRTKETGNWIVATDEMRKWQQIVNAAHFVKEDYERLQSKDVVQENKRLLEENKHLHERVDDLYNSWKEVSAENRELKSTNECLRARIDDLKSEIGFVYKSVKDLLKERTDNVKSLKNVFGDLVDKLRDKILGSQFEYLYRREQTRERNKGPER